MCSHATAVIHVAVRQTYCEDCETSARLPVAWITRNPFIEFVHAPVQKATPSGIPAIWRIQQ